MQVIIDGESYDTETSTLVATWTNGASEGDFGYCCEQLYRKPDGEFFLAGEGGGTTRWAEAVGDGIVTHGRGILVLSESEAHEWLSSNVQQQHGDE